MALLLGLATIVAGVFTWRAGQLGSSAAFDDRQSVSQTIQQQQQQIEVGLGAVDNASAYVRYVAEYAEAAALDDTADELAGQGAEGFAEATREEAANLRVAASAVAAASGVFGQQSLYQDLATARTTPRPFDFEEQLQMLEAEVTTGIRSPGRLDPDHWADEADDLRRRVRGLRVGAFVLILSVAIYTIAQVAQRQVTRVVAGSLGLVVFLTATGVTLATVY